MNNRVKGENNNLLSTVCDISESSHDALEN